MKLKEKKDKWLIYNLDVPDQVLSCSVLEGSPLVTRHILPGAAESSSLCLQSAGPHFGDSGFHRRLLFVPVSLEEVRLCATEAEKGGSGIPGRFSIIRQIEVITAA